jgi:hypothetical protein
MTIMPIEAGPARTQITTKAVNSADLSLICKRRCKFSFTIERVVDYGAAEATTQ